MKMAQVPMRMAQPGLVASRQQHPPMIVSMTQPPPVSMQGLVTMAPMMGHAGGMAVMTQAMSHHDSTREHVHAMNGPYGPPHHSHPPPHHHPLSHPPQLHGGHHHRHSGPNQPCHIGATTTQYHPHSTSQQNLGGHHNNPHNLSHSGHHGHTVSHIPASHCNMPTSSTHQGHMQATLPLQHSAQHQKMNNVNTPIMNSNQQKSFVAPNQPPQPYIPTATIIQQPEENNTQMPLVVDKGPPISAGMIVLNNNNGQNRIAITSTNATNGMNEINSTVQVSGYDNSIPDVLDSMAMREKTPMCLINELARYNKIPHQYSLTDEVGPAHKKIFTVTLCIGDTEEYLSSGASIKKAQHSAASVALKNTKFKHPPPKPPRQMQPAKLTPTVELNALAMKRGEVTAYSIIEAPRPPPNPYPFNVAHNIRTMYNQKHCYPPFYSIFFVNLKVGAREFMGEGPTSQQAKHNAASKALKSMKTLPLPKNSCPNQADLTELDPNADIKSPISVVHEIALKRNFQVMFEVVRESGPPHMRTFITTCIVGDFRTQGEGTGKKASKKKAAELMLEKLRSSLPPLPPNTLGVLKRKPTTKKKSRNLIKVGQEEQKAATEYGQGVNPISRLIQIQQAKKEREPLYALIAERGVQRKREFVMQVTVGSENATGNGPNKKLAKRAAAENMLLILGYSRSPLPTKPVIKMEGSHAESDKARKQVTIMEETTELARPSNKDNTPLTTNLGGGRQLVPGLILMPDGTALHGYPQVQQMKANVFSSVNMQATATIAKELLECGTSATAKAMATPNGSNSHQQINSSQTASSPPKTMCIQQIPGNRQTQAAAIPSTQLQSTPDSNTQQKYSHNQQSVTVKSTTDAVSSKQQITTRNNVSLSITPTDHAVSSKDQLLYLANILSLQVSFTDFPQVKQCEFISLVTLATKPSPYFSHGKGATIDASHEQACLNTLRSLAQMGLDSVTQNKEDDQ